MNERLGIENAIRLLEGTNREQATRLREAYNNYTVAKEITTTFINGVRDSLEEINQRFASSGEIPFILSYRHLNEALEKQRDKIKNLEAKRDAARARYTAADEKLKANVPYTEVEAEKAEIKKEWDQYNLEVTEAWEKYRELEARKNAVQDPEEFNKSCCEYSYLQSMIDAVEAPLLNGNISIAYDEMLSQLQQRVMNEQFNNEIQGMLYKINLDMESIKQRQDVIDKSTSIFKAISKELGIEFIYSENQVESNQVESNILGVSHIGSTRTDGSTGSSGEEELKELKEKAQKLIDSTKTKMILWSDDLSPEDKQKFEDATKELEAAIVSGNKAEITAKESALSTLANEFKNQVETYKQKVAEADHQAKILIDATKQQMIKWGSKLSAEDKQKLEDAIQALKTARSLIDYTRLEKLTTRTDALSKLVTEIQSRIEDPDQELTEAQEQAQKLIEDTQKSMAEWGNKLGTDVQQKISELIKEIEEAVTNNDVATIKAKCKTLEALVDEIKTRVEAYEALNQASKVLIGADDERRKQGIVEDLKRALANKDIDEIKNQTKALNEILNRSQAHEKDQQVLSELNKNAQKLRTLGVSIPSELDKKIKDSIHELEEAFKVNPRNDELIEAKRNQLNAVAQELHAFTQAHEKLADLTKEYQSLKTNLAEEDQKRIESLINNLKETLNKDYGNNPDFIKDVQAAQKELEEAMQKALLKPKAQAAIKDAEKLLTDLEGKIAEEGQTKLKEKIDKLKAAISTGETEKVNQCMDELADVIKTVKAGNYDVYDQSLIEQAKKHLKAVKRWLTEDEIEEYEKAIEDAKEALAKTNEESKIQEELQKLNEIKKKMEAKANGTILIEHVEDKIKSLKKKVSAENKELITNKIKELQGILDGNNTALMEEKTKELSELTDKIVKEARGNKIPFGKRIKVKAFKKALVPALVKGSIMAVALAGGAYFGIGALTGAWLNTFGASSMIGGIGGVLSTLDLNRPLAAISGGIAGLVAAGGPTLIIEGKRAEAELKAEEAGETYERPKSLWQKAKGLMKGIRESFNKKNEEPEQTETEEEEQENIQTNTPPTDIGDPFAEEEETQDLGAGTPEPVVLEGESVVEDDTLEPVPADQQMPNFDYPFPPFPSSDQGLGDLMNMDLEKASTSDLLATLNRFAETNPDYKALTSSEEAPSEDGARKGGHKGVLTQSEIDQLVPQVAVGMPTGAPEARSYPMTQEEIESLLSGGSIEEPETGRGR